MDTELKLQCIILLIATKGDAKFSLVIFLMTGAKKTSHGPGFYFSRVGPVIVQWVRQKKMQGISLLLTSEKGRSCIVVLEEDRHPTTVNKFKFTLIIYSFIVAELFVHQLNGC